MSDVLKAFECYKFKQEVSLSTEHCLNYVRQQCSAGNKFSLTVCILNKHLRVSYDLKENRNLSDFSYVEILNACIAEHGMKIQKDCTRIESLLYKSCCNVKSKSTKLAALMGKTAYQLAVSGHAFMPTLNAGSRCSRHVSHGNTIIIF